MQDLTSPTRDQTHDLYSGSCRCCSVTKLCSDSLGAHGLQHTRLPNPSPSHSLFRFMSIESVMLTISSSASLFSFCLQSFPVSGPFPVSRLFTSGGQSIVASASFLPVNIQGWFPLGLTGFISLQSKGLSRVFSSTTIQKKQFFSAQPCSWSNSHILTWLLG